MLKNYIKIAIRNLKTHKLYSAINIGGLSIGMAVSFILLLFIYDEFTHDQFHVRKDRIFKLKYNQPSEKGIETDDGVPKVLAEVIQKDIPEVERVIRTDWGGKHILTVNDKILSKNGYFVDPAFLQTFSFKLLKGEVSSVFKDIESIVLTEKAAKTLFGETDPINQLVKLDNEILVKVTGIVMDPPANSTFRFEFLSPWELFEKKNPWVKSSGWGSYSFNTYVELKPSASEATVNSKIKNLIGKYDPENKDNTLFLHPLKRWHLYGEFKDGINTGGKIEYVRLFLFLALGILLIACINFMNLSTARSEKRAREVGVRKVIGAKRSHLIQQFLGESVLMALIAFGLAVLLVSLCLPYFNTITKEELSTPLQNPYAWVIGLGVTLLTGFISGSYPAIFLSSFQPVRVLKGQLKVGKAALRPREVLVVIQFTFAIALIIATILIYKQISFIKSRPLGYDNSNLIQLYQQGKLVRDFDRFKNDLLESGAIIAGCKGSSGLINVNNSSWGARWPGQLPGEEKIPIAHIATTYDFTKTFDIQIKEGRDFSPSFLSDSSGILLNEEAVNLMRLKDPIGQNIEWQGGKRTIVGVVKNFVWGNPYEPTKPLVVSFNPDWSNVATFRLNPYKPASESLARIEKAYKTYNPEYNFEYRFIDEMFEKKFETETLLGTLANWFAGLAIFISCLGLLGLATFSAEQRRKEIGIRKVLGASVSHLWFNLSKDFLRLVIIAFLIAAPISWYFMNDWLSQYTYKTTISLWVFLATISIALFISVITVSWQTIKAAISTPAKNLRTE